MAIFHFFFPVVAFSKKNWNGTQTSVEKRRAHSEKKNEETNKKRYNVRLYAFAGTGTVFAEAANAAARPAGTAVGGAGSVAATTGVMIVSCFVL